MLRQVHEAHPEAAVIGTNNAEVNAPILSINARVGFKIAWRNVDYQVTRDALDEWQRDRISGEEEELGRWRTDLQSQSFLCSPLWNGPVTYRTQRSSRRSPALRANLFADPGPWSINIPGAGYAQTFECAMTAPAGRPPKKN